MRDSFIFYKSFYDAIKKRNQKLQTLVYNAIFSYVFEGEEIPLTPEAESIFILIKPQIDANTARYKNGKLGAEFGKLGGRPKKEKRNPIGVNEKNPIGVINKKPQKTPNVNVNVNDNDNVNENVNYIETSNDVSCSELKKAPSCKNPKGDIVIELPLNDGSMFPVYSEQINEWKSLYGNVDIEQQLKNMKGWLLSNPSRRKTSKGIMRFINSWLTSEQDKGSKAANPGYSANSSTRRVYGTPRDQASNDAAVNAIWQSCEEILKDGK